MLSLIVEILKDKIWKEQRCKNSTNIENLTMQFEEIKLNEINLPIQTSFATFNNVKL